MSAADLFLSESSVERAERRMRVTQERMSQGLPPTLTDPVGLAVTASVLRATTRRSEAS